MSPNALRGAKPDRAETSIIAALAGFAGRVSLAVCEGVPAVVAASVLLVSVSGTFRAHLGAGGDLVLFGLDMGQHCAEVFVVGDRRVRDALLMRIEDGAGQGNAIVPNLDAPVRELVGVGVFTDQTARQIVDLQPDALVVVLQGQILADIAFVAQTEDLGQPIRCGVLRTVQIIRTGSGLGKPVVIAFHEARKEGICSLHVRDARDAQLFDQAVL